MTTGAQNDRYAKLRNKEKSGPRLKSKGPESGEVDEVQRAFVVVCVRVGYKADISQSGDGSSKETFACSKTT